MIECPLLQVCNIDYGKRVVKSRDLGSHYDVYGGGGKTFKVDNWNRENSMIVSRFGMSPLAVRYVTGKFFLNDSGLTVSAKNSSVLLQSYIDWFLLYANDQIYSLGRGSAQRNLDVKAFGQLTIRYPKSITQQQIIVDKLMKSFEKIDKAIELTDLNAKNSKILYANTLTEIFNSIEHANLMPLGKVYDVRDGTHDSPKYGSEGFPLVTSKNLKSGSLSLDNIQYISAADYKKINERSRVDKGDVLLAMIGTIGNPVIVEHEPNFAIKNVALFKPLNKHDGRFLKYYLESGDVKRKMDTDAKGATQRFVSLGYLRLFKFPVISQPEEQEIIARLDSASKSTNHLQSSYIKRLHLLRNLKTSLLNQSFSGKVA